MKGRSSSLALVLALLAGAWLLGSAVSTAGPRPATTLHATPPALQALFGPGDLLLGDPAVPPCAGMSCYPTCVPPTPTCVQVQGGGLPFCTCV